MMTRSHVFSVSRSHLGNGIPAIEYAEWLNFHSEPGGLARGVGFRALGWSRARPLSAAMSLGHEPPSFLVSQR